MTTDRAKANEVLTRRLLEEIFVERKEAALYDLLDEDFEYHLFVRDEPFRQRETLIQTPRGFASGLPGYRIELADVVASDEKAMCRAILRGRHTGYWTADPMPGAEDLGRSGLERIPPTGRDVEVWVVLVLTFANGKIARIRALMDPALLLAQMGVMPKMKGVPPPAIWLARLRGLFRRRSAP